ncbi:MAG: helix-turn-helix transcriptional regulator, partial [Clostridia bacterium]|nr:helix-turn-helix transcriptional regulator [Clostridia bacterium]
MNKETIVYKFPELFLNIKEIDMANKISHRKVHIHSAVEIIICHNGEIEWNILEDSVCVNKGEILIINRNIPHELQVNKEGVFTYIQIDISPYLDVSGEGKINLIYDFIIQNNCVKHLLFKGESPLKKITDIILSEAGKMQRGYDFCIKAEIYNLLALMNRNYMLFNRNELSGAKLKMIEPVYTYIENNFKSDFTLDKLCADVGCNKYTACKRFKSVTGKTIMDYTNFIRLKTAKHMLKEKDKLISEVAFECGFSSIQYFNKVFKANVGCTPKQFS